MLPVDLPKILAQIQMALLEQLILEQAAAAVLELIMFLLAALEDLALSSFVMQTLMLLRHPQLDRLL
jgi:hypothetical protein